jgi:hypothetical protein
VATTVASGDWLQKALRPLTRKVPSSATAVVVGHSQSDRHPPQYRLGVSRTLAVPEDLGQRQVLVHGRGERRGPVVAGQLGLGVAHLAHRGAKPAQLGGHRQAQVAGGTHGCVRLADEGGIAVVVGGVLGGHGPDLGRQADEPVVVGPDGRGEGSRPVAGWCVGHGHAVRLLR